MGDNLKEKLGALGERLKVGGAEVGRKVTERMNSVGDKVKEMFQASNGAVDRLVEEATGAQGFDTDWGAFMDICDMVSGNKITGQDVARSLRKRLANARDPRCELLTLQLLEALVKNCDRMFSEVAAEKVLDELVRLVDDPRTASDSRDKALKLIESWGEATEELRYLPVFEETYKSLKSRGVVFPGRDAESLAPIFTPPQTVEPSSIRTGVSRLTMRDVVSARSAAEIREHVKASLDVARNSIELLTTVLSSAPRQEVLTEDVTMTLVEQCRQSQFMVQRAAQSPDNDELLLELLSVNDELEKVLAKYEEISKLAEESKEPPLPTSDESAFVIVDDDSDADEPLVRNKTGSSISAPNDDDPLADLDKMIFGNKHEAKATAAAATGTPSSRGADKDEGAP